MAAAEFLRELKDALNAFRFDDARALVNSIDPHQFDAKQASKTLALLRKKRLFEELEAAAMAFFTAGLNDPRLQRHHAQALIDQGRLYPALNSLRRLAPAVEDDPKEGPEVRGLIGRTLKQRYVNDGDPQALKEAIAAYEVDGQKAPDENLWHGINVVACIKRAERDGIATESSVDADALAIGILAAVESADDVYVWDRATALEAAVALGDEKTALQWLKLYARDPGADAFELGSTLRQLEEIWQLRGTDLGGAILPVLEYERLQRTGGTAAPPEKPGNNAGFEAVYGTEANKPLAWLDALRERCRSIARLHDEVDGRPAGTGFLAKGGWLNKAWGDAPVLVTNSHVISETESDQAPLTPEDAVAEFTRLDGRPRVKPGELLFSSVREKFDISVLRIEAPEGCAPLSLTSYTPTAGPGDDAAKVYVAGHPGGRELEVTLYDNELREIEDRYARYRCPTEGGQSGSPVFNGKWKPFALHHRAVDEKQLNEGILFEAIRAEIGGG
jgi:hypothetical protein